MKFLTLIFLCLFATTTNSFAKWKEGFGGDQVVIEFHEIGLLLADQMSHVPLLKVNNIGYVDISDKIRELLQDENKLTISTEPTVYLEGVEKDAVNYPYENPPRLILGRQHWQNGDVAYRHNLVLHELLHLMQIDDSSYYYSSRIMNNLSLLEQLKIRFDSVQMDFQVSTRECNIQRVLDLQKLGADIKQTTPSFQALNASINAGCNELVSYFISQGVNLNYEDIYGESLFQLAVEKAAETMEETKFKRSMEVLQFLLEAGANPNAVNWSVNSGKTSALHYLAKLYQTPNLDEEHAFHYKTIQQFLLGFPNININVTDSNGETPIFKMLGATQVFNLPSYVEALRSIIAAKADLNHANIGEQYPIDKLVIQKDDNATVEILNLLLDSGAKHVQNRTAQSFTQNLLYKQSPSSNINRQAEVLVKIIPLTKNLNASQVVFTLINQFKKDNVGYSELYVADMIVNTLAQHPNAKIDSYNMCQAYTQAHKLSFGEKLKSFCGPYHSFFN